MMTNKQAYDYWKRKYESARDYYDEHWEADERHAHRNMLKHLCLQYVHLECGAPQLKKIKFIGDTVMMPIADFNKLNAEK